MPMGTLSGAGFKSCLILSLIKIRIKYGKKFNLFNNFSFSYDFINSIKFTFMLREPIDLPPIVSVELIDFR